MEELPLKTEELLFAIYEPRKPVITDIKLRPGTGNTIVDYKVTNNDTHSDAILFHLQIKVHSGLRNNKGTILKRRTITTSDRTLPMVRLQDLCSCLF